MAVKNSPVNLYNVSFEEIDYEEKNDCGLDKQLQDEIECKLKYRLNKLRKKWNLGYKLQVECIIRKSGQTYFNNEEKLTHMLIGYSHDYYDKIILITDRNVKDAITSMELEFNNYVEEQYRGAMNMVPLKSIAYKYHHNNPLRLLLETIPDMMPKEQFGFVEEKLLKMIGGI